MADRDISSLAKPYLNVRAQTEALARPLSEADAQIQSMSDASPAKWHLAHTNWFFETFVLGVYQPDYRPFDPHYNYLFNSYYNGIGAQYPRAKRGLISRPSLAEVLEYRAYVDAAMQLLLRQNGARDDINEIVTLGLQHEQQHQELLLTDIKHALWQNPAYPAYSGEPVPVVEGTARLQWLPISAGLYAIGADNQGFAFDNERPSHQVYLQDARIANRLVTNHEFLAFIDDGGYQNPALWLSDGWAWVQQNNISQPLYWRHSDHGWQEFSLFGSLDLAPQRPVCHVNYYEANAFAHWAGARLPTEAEWETACLTHGNQVQLHKSPNLHPQATAGDETAMLDAFAQVWQWTTSSYQAYPGFKPMAGNAGEYNGKFMSNQQVLRGSSCATAASHSRASYRNFFYAQQRWQFSGIRLAGEAQ